MLALGEQRLPQGGRCEPHPHAESDERQPGAVVVEVLAEDESHQRRACREHHRRDAGREGCDRGEGEIDAAPGTSLSRRRRGGPPTGA